MPTYNNWKFAKRPAINHECPSLEVNNHPLKVELNKIIRQPVGSKKNFLETLEKWSFPLEELDPLLRFEQMNLEEDSKPLENDVVNYIRLWQSKRTTILNKYTTGEKLTIISSFLPEEEKVNSFSALIRQVSNLNEKVKHRLEQLDEFDESSVRKTMGLSQQEFVTKIHMLDDEIKKAWDSEQRVKAFKIAIQCSKLLSDISVMQFYPSKFVLITDILHKFGNLVYDRLKHKSFGSKVIEFQDIQSELVPEAAKETCQNWMFKMASIRELLPRLYMEMSLLKCYVFTSRGEIKPAIDRITIMIRGIGNPLVAVYLRVYLCNVSAKLVGKDSEEYFAKNFKEFIDDYQQIFSTNMSKKFGTQLLTPDQYLSLYIPAVEWLLYGTLNSNNNKAKLLDELLQQCNSIENNELLLFCVLSTFDSPNIIEKSSQILEIIKKSADNMVMLSGVLHLVGGHVCTCESYRASSSEALSQAWWRLAAAVRAPNDFLHQLEPWLQFVCMQLSSQHINMILRGTIRYMIKSGSAADEYCAQLQATLKRVLTHVPDVEELFLMDAFMPLVELVQKSTARTAMAKTVLTIFFERFTGIYIEDPIVISGLMRLCCILHDSINAVSVEAESKMCADLIVKFVQAVTYHDDLEQQLNFYVECRASFIKLDAVLLALVHAVNTLGARASARGVARACAAYAFVTVPSLRCVLTRAPLYLLGAQVALLNNCVGQAEANLKSLVGLIPDIPLYIQQDGQNKSTHDQVLGLLCNFLSTLLVLPDNMESSNKAYILSGFIKTMERIHWKKTEPLYYNVLLKTLDLVCEMAQETYAYRIDSVLSNDQLYGCEEEFVSCLSGHAGAACRELLTTLATLGAGGGGASGVGGDSRRQSALALELFWRVTRRAALADPPTAQLAANLWALATKHQDHNHKLALSMLSALKTSGDVASEKLYARLKDGC
ncbi:VPS35 endosomal protein-sorting factor-like isoform X2 [Aricia agestis]|uniref:VPS35 endosomal protein-sorting factor-like isoform X2 n=1 Tax=Aricia agestis TaxID=91739 RepID=UPI001C208A26|nr:VPS35 endosomal protein-sorting factor-like isoform X2 [Aricia agestis]